MKYRTVRIHVIFWAIFIIYEVVMDKSMGSPASFLEYGCFYILNIAIFYITASVVLQRLLTGATFSTWFVTILLCMLELIVYCCISILINNAFKQSGFRAIFTHAEKPILLTSVWRGVYFIMLGGAYFAIMRAIKAIKESHEAKINELTAQRNELSAQRNELAAQRKSEKLAKELVNLQNAYLQAQVNPHFLFNTLSFIYNQAEEGHPDTPKNISLLSEIMQYSLTSMGKDGKVPLCQELNQIKRYISLNLSRFENTLFLKEQILFDEEAGQARIPPLILLTFIENVFKHGDMTHKEFPAVIKISYSEGTLMFYTKNRKRKPRQDNRQHVGLKNAFMRLNDSFKKECIDFSTDESHTDYEFKLKLKL